MYRDYIQGFSKPNLAQNASKHRHHNSQVFTQEYDPAIPQNSYQQQRMQEMRAIRSMNNSPTNFQRIAQPSSVVYQGPPRYQNPSQSP